MDAAGVSTVAQEQAVYYFGPAVEKADVSTGRYPLANVTIRQAEDIRMVPERGTLGVSGVSIDLAKPALAASKS